jgi:hypothetical protein
MQMSSREGEVFFISASFSYVLCDVLGEQGNSILTVLNVLN